MIFGYNVYEDNNNNLHIVAEKGDTVYVAQHWTKDFEDFVNNTNCLISDNAEENKYIYRDYLDAVYGNSSINYDKDELEEFETDEEGYIVNILLKELDVNDMYEKLEV